MIRKTYRAGAFASALMMMTLIAAPGSRAVAQSDDAVIVMPPFAADTSSRQPVAEAPLPRFVAEPVVQPLPEEPVQVPADAASLAALVDALPAEAPLSRDVECLAQAVYFEARGEPLDGQLAVAQVIVNRTRSPQFPPDYCGVVAQRAQFSFVRNGRIPAAPRDTRAWQRASAIARIAHQDLWDSPAEDALFFHASTVRPGWARTKLARATIERHVFYR